MSETLTLTSEQTELIALAASTLAGGRHAFRVKDADARESAQTLAVSARMARARGRNAARMAVARMDAARAAAWRTYDASIECDASQHDATCCRIGALHNVWSMTPKRSRVRDIARAILAPDAVKSRIRMRITTPDERREMTGIPAWETKTAARVDREYRAIVAGWRDTVRAYRDGRSAAREIGGFELSRADMTATAESRFYRYAVKHWHGYAGGKHVAIHGVTPDDVTQDAYVSALESRDGLTFGGMYMHSRMALESAVFAYRRMGNGHGSNNVPAWTWADWQTRAAEPMSIEEWQAFDAERAYRNARADYDASVAVERERAAETLAESRRHLFALVSTGLSVRQIANVLGRTVAGILADIERTDAPAVRFV